MLIGKVTKIKNVVKAPLFKLGLDQIYIPVFHDFFTPIIICMKGCAILEAKFRNIFDNSPLEPNLRKLWFLSNLFN